MIINLIIAISFFLIGAICALIYTHQMQREKIRRYESLLEAEKEHRTHLESTLKVAAMDALKQNAEVFMQSAIKDMNLIKAQTDQQMTLQTQQVTQSVEWMKQRLEQCQKAILEFEGQRQGMYTRLDDAIGRVLASENSLRIETASLKEALSSSSSVRGRWGEKVLLDILEQNDLVQGVHFETQVAVSGEVDSIRPDVIVNMPGGRKLALDAKEVSGEYLEALNAQTSDERSAHMDKLAVNIRSNFLKLSKKNYAQSVDKQISFVIMFIPSEAVIRAAFSHDPSLFDEAMQKRVVLASPMTIIPLIQLIRHAWGQHQAASNAIEITKIVDELGARMSVFMDHLLAMRSSLDKTVDCFNRAQGSWEKRVLPQIDKAKNLGAKLGETQPLESIENH